MEEMLAKFIDEGRREHEEMEIFIKEFRTTNELLLKERSNLLTLVQILKYVKHRKSLLTNKSRLERACMETMNERYTSVLLNKLPLKEKDPRSFSIPCQVLEKHKEAEDLAAYHLPRFENPHMEVLTEREIADKFFDEHLMVLKSKFINDEPWYGDFVNYIVGKDLLVRIIVLMLPQRRFTSSIFKDANKLVYGKACHLPVEIEHKAHWALKQCNMDLTLASESHLMQLNELAELRDGAYDNTRIYKEQTKKWHDSRLHDDKDFKVGDRVLLYNSCLKMYPGKLKTKWSGSNIVKTIYPYGAVEIINKNRLTSNSMDND
uniref:Reverse transcriptase domain-containing protein n=1 Tax=Tanacetum cinerariifolium TaxID=118510 RepID=A0A6L2J8N7_TANCI|nr:hypothetical protein [Tanacetum cinerariifolium]